MQPEIENKLEQIRSICAHNDVQRLYLFGSALDASTESAQRDVDLLDDFLPLGTRQHARRYFALQEELEAVLRRPVDLAETTAIRNPYVRKTIEATRRLLYEAA
jgi:predicted nucleotidyltransferase